MIAGVAKSTLSRLGTRVLRGLSSIKLRSVALRTYGKEALKRIAWNKFKTAVKNLTRDQLRSLVEEEIAGAGYPVLPALPELPAYGKS